MLGCNHRRTTFPLTRRTATAENDNTYVVCLDCGKEFVYDWKQMRLGKPVTPPLSASATPLIPAA